MFSSTLRFGLLAALALPFTTFAQTPVLASLGPQGLSLTQPDASFQLRIRGVLQADGRDYFATSAAQPPPSQFLIRRARLYVEGTLADFIDFRLLPDFGQGQLQLLDAFLDFKLAPWLNLRAGKFKSPFGLERLVAEQNLVFIERGLSSNLVPDRDIGAALHGELARGQLLYEVALVNGTLDNGNVDGDVDGRKDLAARLYARPLRRLWPAGRELGLGIAGTWGDERGNATAPLLAPYRTAGQQLFFTYLTDSRTPANSVVAAGVHRRLSPQAYEAVGPVGVLAELVYSQQTVAGGGARATPLTHRAWQVQASWVLTGEAASYEGVRPEHPFSLSRHEWGAVELAARYGELQLDRATFPRFADPSRSSREARAWAAGANWHLSRNAKLALNFERTTFQGGATRGDRAPEDALVGRVQAAF